MESIYDNKQGCCGCTACYSICPTQAIKMKEDEKGFKYPVIDKKKCINCKQCIKVCPMQNKGKTEIKNQEVYAAKNRNKEERARSSSGGVFIKLAEHIISKGGCVFGAAYNESQEVVHIKIENIEEIYKLQTSKYVQSDMGNIYKEVKDELKSGRYALFSGTPCQIQGLLNTLNNVDKDKLITCDIVCHGVPSPQFFKDYKENLENKYGSKIDTINFRYKNGINTTNMKIKLKNGEEYLENSAKDSYYRLFYKNYILRESCFSCPFTNLERNSDITIGDFWGIEKSIKDFDDKNGVSLVIINSQKGKELFEDIKLHFEIIKSDTENCLQPNLISPSKKPNEYDKFWEDYLKKGYKHVVKKYKIIICIKRIKNKLYREYKKISRGRK